MKYSVPTIALIATVFLLAQVVGLATNKHYFTSDLPYGIQPPEIEEKFSPLYFIGLIIVASVVFIMFKRLKFELLNPILQKHQPRLKQ